MDTWYLKSNDGQTFHYVLSNNKRISICNNQTVDNEKQLLDNPPTFRKLCPDCRTIYNIVVEQLKK